MHQSVIAELKYNTVLLCVDYDENVLKRYNLLFESSKIQEGTTRRFDSLYTTRRSIQINENRTIHYNLILALGAEDAYDIAIRLRTAGKEIAVAFFDLHTETKDMFPVIRSLRAIFPSLVCAVGLDEQFSDRITRPQGLFPSPSEWLYYQSKGTVEQMEQLIAHLISSFIIHREKETALLKNEATRKGLRQILNASPDLLKTQSEPELISEILRNLTKITKVENTFLLKLNKDNEFCFSSGTGSLSTEEEYIKQGFSERTDFFRAVLEDNRIVTLRDGTFSPLSVENAQIGILYLDKNKQIDSELLDVFTHHIAFAMNNHALQAEVKKKQAMEHELNLASRIQESLLPKSFPDVPHLKIYGLTQSAKEIGGDYFDILESNNYLYLCIGDVSGKGVPAGLIMTELRSAVRAFSMSYDSPREILLHSAELLLKDIAGSGKFVSVLLLQWDGSKLLYSSAGHEHIIHYHAKTQKCDAYRSGGVVLGVDFRSFSRLVKEKELELEPDDVIMLFTDGATEAHNEEGEMFKLDKLCQIVEKYHELPVKDMVESILKDVLEFVGAAEQHDDITLLGIKFKPNE